MKEIASFPRLLVIFQIRCVGRKKICWTWHPGPSAIDGSCCERKQGGWSWPDSRSAEAVLARMWAGAGVILARSNCSRAEVVIKRFIDRGRNH